MKARSRLLTSAAALGFAAALAAPASAQPTQEGLVNVNLNDIDVAVPIAVAANICDVGVNVLADARKTGDTACTTTAESGAVFGPGGSERPNQRGLVNVNVSDVTVLVPVSVAANICGLDVNVLAQQRVQGQTACDALGTSTTS